MSPRTLFKVFAITEAITWAGLITAMILRAADVTDAVVRPAGSIHGFVFLVYGVVTVMVWIDHRWSLRTGLLGLGSAIIPFATIPFDLVADRKGLLPTTWRLGSAGDATPQGFLEKLVAWVVTRPALAAVVAIAGVTAVFFALLWIGPPF